jgi:hypothetical protein
MTAGRRRVKGEVGLPVAMPADRKDVELLEGSLLGVPMVAAGRRRNVDRVATRSPANASQDRSCRKASAPTISTTRFAAICGASRRTGRSRSQVTWSPPAC